MCRFVPVRARLPGPALRGAVPLPALRRQLRRHVRLPQQRHVLARDRPVPVRARVTNLFTYFKTVIFSQIHIFLVC